MPAAPAPDGPDPDLVDAVTRLPAKQQQAVTYHYLAGLPHADVAANPGGGTDAARRAAVDGIATLRRTYPGITARKGDLARHLARAYPDTPDGLRRLRERLAGAAQRGGILDVAYRPGDSPGTLLLAGTDLGLVRVAYLSENHDTVLQTPSDRISPRILHAPRGSTRPHGSRRSTSPPRSPPAPTPTGRAPTTAASSASRPIIRASARGVERPGMTSSSGSKVYQEPPQDCQVSLVSRLPARS